MSFRQKLQEQFLVAVKASNISMTKQINTQLKSLNITKKQTKVEKKLTKAQDTRTRSNIRAFTVIDRTGRLVSGLTGRFNLLNVSMYDMIKDLKTGFGTFFKDIVSGFRKFKGDIRPPRGAEGFKLPSLPRTKTGGLQAFDLRTKIGKETPLAKFYAPKISLTERRKIAQRKAQPGLMGALAQFSGTLPIKKREELALTRGRGGFISREKLTGGFAPFIGPREATTGERAQQVRGEFASRLRGEGVGRVAPPEFKQPGKTQKMFKSFKKNIGKPLKDITKNAAGTLGPMMAFAVVLKIFSFFSTVFQPVTDVLNTFLQIIGTGFQPLITALLTELTKPEMIALIMTFTDNISRIFVALSPLIPAFVSLIQIGFIPLQLVTLGLATLFELFAPQIEWVAKAMDDALDPIMDFIALMFGGSPGVIPAFEKAWDVAKVFVDLIFGGFKNAWSFISDSFGAVKGWWDDWIAPVFGKDGFILTGIKLIFDTSKTIINGFISGINSVIDVLNINPLINLSKIPKLAGGPHMVSPPGGLAIVGEGRGPEVVSEMEPLVEAIKEALGGASGGQPITIVFNGVAPGSNIRELATLIGRELRLIR